MNMVSRGTNILVQTTTLVRRRNEWLARPRRNLVRLAVRPCPSPDRLNLTPR